MKALTVELIKNEEELSISMAVRPSLLSTRKPKYRQRGRRRSIRDASLHSLWMLPTLPATPPFLF